MPRRRATVTALGSKDLAVRVKVCLLYISTLNLITLNEYGHIYL